MSTFRILLVTVILAPLAFWPSLYVAPDLVKVIIIALGTLVAAISIFIAARKEGRLVLPPRNLFLMGVSLVVSIVVSALVSGHVGNSFFGQGFEFGTASFLSILFLASFVSYTLAFKHPRRVIIIYVGIVATYCAVALFQFARLVPGFDFLKFSFLRSATSTIVGNWHSFGTYSILVALIAVVAAAVLPLSGRMKIIYWVIGAAGFIGACLAYNKNAWQAAIVVFACLAIHAYVKGSKQVHDMTTSSTFVRRISWIYIIALVISITLFWKGQIILAPIASSLNVAYSEVGLSWRSTLDIATEVASERPLFGIGPNRFLQAYVAHKPAEINLTPAWNMEFISGFGVFPTFVVTHGLVGSALWLVTLIMFILIAIKTLRHLPAEPHQRFILVSSFSGAIFLGIIMMTSVPSHAIIFYFFVMVGMAVGAATSYGVIKPSEILFTGRQGIVQKIMSFVLPILIITCVVWGVVYIKKVIALSYFGEGAKQLTLVGNPDAAYAAFNRASKFDSSDIYSRAEVEALLSRVNLLVRRSTERSPASVSEDDVLNITGTINDALVAARKAIAYDSSDHYNYVSEARIFETAASLKMKGSVDGAVQSYMKAIGVNQYNPSLYLALARFQASQKMFDEALQSAGAAIKVKNNYLEAIFLISQIQAAKGNTQDAIVAATVATEIDPSSPLLFFQLGLLYYTDKQYGPASKALARAIEIQPDYANAQYFLGLALNYQGMRTAAIEQFEKLVVSNPENQEVKLILDNLNAGRAPFAEAQPPITPVPEKRLSLPIKDDSSR